jgi:MazG family protein
MAGDTAVKQEANAGGQLQQLLDIMARLRDPERGCPWDLEQDFASIAPYTLEEAYEVAEAIARGQPAELCEELGDLLFQVVFHAQMASEKGWFDFTAVAEAINAKMIRRHPHVFADATVASAREQTEAWEQHKARERADKDGGQQSALDGVPLALPALVRAQKLQRRAARTGFDWSDTAQVIDKLEEELRELRQAVQDGESTQRVREELGDLLFSGVNLARFLDADAETLLRDASNKFAARFQLVEAFAKADARALAACTLDQLENYWQQAKQQLAGGKQSST